MMRRSFFALVLWLAAQSLAAAEIPSLLLPDTPQAPAPRALRLAEKSVLEPLAVLKSAQAGAGDQLDAIAAWNRSGRVPAKNGFARPLPTAKSVRFTAALLKETPSRLAGGALLAPPGGGLVWGAEVQVEGSHRLRLHLANVHLPAGTQMWVYDQDGDEEVPFTGDAMLSGDEIWTPSVAGPAARIEVRLPEGAVAGSGFTVDQVLELFDLDGTGTPLSGGAKADDISCLKDAACYNSSSLSNMDLYKHAVAHLQFVDGGTAYICSGALMNDTDTTTTIPYLLTAHHCFSTQASASTLEAFFDYIDSSCLGSAPSLSIVPRTVGATLLASNAATDFTFLRLSGLPSGRGLLGSTSEAIPAGTVLYRLSHPLGLPMGYSVTTVTAGEPTCSGLPRPNFLYSVQTVGGTAGGSSGSPTVRGSDGRVVGQLLGACGFDPENPCSDQNSTVDGALSGTWAAISQWLAPAGGTPGTCVAGPTSLCLGSGGRFKVQATFDTGTQNGQAQVVKLTDDTGYLWFFAASNVEVVVKVLDACSYNQRFWIYAGGLTNVQVTLTVTDTKTGTVKTYSNPLGTAFKPVQDTSALATCP